ncbi:beta-microseminoprotein-like [Sarcophilus harrisii]|uniref:Beta-microseminoprotein n=1 Tax=Sarcophilus harrisii TaxID=9305 RepID=A0A7N4P2J1_SARHA|nr:beta-microseminoprotein-like [Sarcophilus harrisii]
MLIVLLALAIFVTLCDAFCTYLPLEIRLGIPLKGCRDDRGKMHKFNSEWDQDCMHCVCHESSGIICCSMTLRPMLYDKEKCTEIFKPDKCSYIAVERNNPSELCQVGYYMG